MRQLISASLLGTVLLLGQTHAGQAHDNLDVAGLSSGMSVDEVTDKLGKDFKKADTVAIKRGQVVNFSKADEAFNLLAMGKSKLVYVEHHQLFASKEKMISADELNKALTKKYGQPSFVADDQSLNWVFVDGKLLSGDAVTDQVRACANYDTQGPFIHPLGRTDNFVFYIPKIPVQPQYVGCGTVIQEKTQLYNDNPGLVTQYGVSLFDTKAAQDWYDSAVTDYNKIKSDEIDAARKNKPNL